MSSTSDSCNKSNNNNVCDVSSMLQNLSTADISVCANCGKEGNSDNMNICNKCKMVKYCNAACKKKHRHKHKKQCEEYVRLAAERAAELHDEKLFKQPPPAEDCPICFVRLPLLDSGSIYYSCCGKVICSGCVYAPLYDNQGNEVDNKKCPFCRTPHHTSEEEIAERYKSRMEVGDPIAIYGLGNYYRDGKYGLSQDYTKALELYHRAGELGYALAYNCIGIAYNNGEGVEVDKKKATHYFELAAIGGSVHARYNLGCFEGRSGNIDRAIKHFMIAVGSGHSNSLNQIKRLYSIGHATKEDYMKALQLYQMYLGEIKSPQRDKAAAEDEENQYY